MTGREPLRIVTEVLRRLLGFVLLLGLLVGGTWLFAVLLARGQTVLVLTPAGGAGTARGHGNVRAGALLNMPICNVSVRSPRELAARLSARSTPGSGGCWGSWSAAPIIS